MLETYELSFTSLSAPRQSTPGVVLLEVTAHRLHLQVCCMTAVLPLTGARSAVCEVPFDYIASETQGGLGGTCVLRGCVPKKLLSYGGEFINDFKAAEGYG